MKKKLIYPKVAVDMFFVQGGWTLWFISIMTIIHIVKAVVSLKTGSTHEPFFVSFTMSSNIYMLVIGIIAAYAFLPYYVKNGVTRKDHFKGATLGAIGLAMAIVMSSAVIAGLEWLILSLANHPLEIDNSAIHALTEGDDDILIAQILKMVVAVPFVDYSSNWFLAFGLASLNLYTSYIIGWLIGAGYYHSGWIAGFGFIALSIILMSAWDLLWGSKLGAPVSTWLEVEAFDLPVVVSLICSLVVIVFILWIIRLLTRRVTVKL